MSQTHIQRGAAPRARARATVSSLGDVAHDLVSQVIDTDVGRATLVGMSGIEGAGKTHLARILATELEWRGLRVAIIGTDPWQNPATVRFGGTDPGRHYYEHAIRFDALFDQLVEPLVARRSIRFSTKDMRTDRDAWDDVGYEFEDIDVVLVEGAFLFKQRFVYRYDQRIWIECSVETAARRALARNAERGAVEPLPEAWWRICRSAQDYHDSVDDPRALADLIFDNDDPA